MLKLCCNDPNYTIELWIAHARGMQVTGFIIALLCILLFVIIFWGKFRLQRSVSHEQEPPVTDAGMLRGLMFLGKASVEDILVPRSDIIGIDLDRPWYEIIEQLENAQHTRLPLYRGSVDNLVGIVHLRNVLNLVLDEELTEENLLKIAEEPYYVPTGTRLDIQLANFQKMKRRSGFVVNEYGDLQGLITMEDILEEIVGEFTTDIADLSKDIMPGADGTFLIDASINLRDLQRLLSVEFPEVDGPRTLSGYIIEYLGYIPPADCCLRIDQYQIEILKVSGNTVKSVRLASPAIKLTKKNDFMDN